MFHHRQLAKPIGDMGKTQIIVLMTKLSLKQPELGFLCIAFFLLSSLEFGVDHPAHIRSHDSVLIYVQMCVDLHLITARNTVLYRYCILYKSNILANRYQGSLSTPFLLTLIIIIFVRIYAI